MSKMQALEAFKIKIILEDMNQKLEYLELLKNSMGEEMAEMMSEEITKVMDEQRQIELEYARLVQQRDDLKGINNKHRLEETKQDIMRVAKELKDSTKKLCRQLQKKPAVEGNQQQVKNHKRDLIKVSRQVVDEMEQNLAFSGFARNIQEQIDESHKYERLKDQERDLTMQINDTTAKFKKLQNEFTREQEENNKEMRDLKIQVNETQIEKDLYLQYMERYLQGQQSCADRIYKKVETEKEKRIEELKKILKTEQEVNSAVVDHLNMRNQQLNKLSKDREQKREAEIARIDEEKNMIKQKTTEAVTEMEQILQKIAEDDKLRQEREQKQAANAAEEEAKIKEKLSMDDAARYIQRRWVWFQTEGKFLAKKSKKGRKGRKKKK